jgi:hypothetical protein
MDACLKVFRENDFSFSEIKGYVVRRRTLVGTGKKQFFAFNCLSMK